jgi:hypothetical protein
MVKFHLTWDNALANNIPAISPVNIEMDRQGNDDLLS